MTFVFCKIVVLYFDFFTCAKKRERRAVVAVEVLEMIVFSFTFVGGWMAYEVAICYCYCLTCLLCALEFPTYLCIIFI